jgi:hypothetical protein
MTFPIEYIKIPATILCRTDLPNTAKMLLGLIAGFGSKGLMLSNPQLAKVLCCCEDYIGKLLNELKEFIRIENPQSRYRKIFYSVENKEVETTLLRQNQGSEAHSTPHCSPATPSYSSATPNHSTDINKVTKKNINIISSQESMRFVKPVPEEVQAYAQSIGCTLDSQNFCDYYESKGWMIGKSKMRNWQAAVRTWKRNQNAYGKKDKLPRISQEVKNDGNYETITA